jgi:hypothetical protein
VTGGDGMRPQAPGSLPRSHVGAAGTHSPPGPLGRWPPKGPFPQHPVELHFGADVQRVRVRLLQGRRWRHRVGLGREHHASVGLPAAGPAGTRGRREAVRLRSQAARDTVGVRPIERRRRAGPARSRCIKACGAPGAPQRGAGRTAGGGD